MDYIWMINSFHKHSIFFWIFCKLPTQTHVKQRLNILGLVLVFFLLKINVILYTKNYCFGTNM